MFLVVAAVGIFTIVPKTQYVYFNHNVTFECATNLTGYSLEFTSVKFKQADLPSGGRKVSTTFIVDNFNNGTGVRCLAVYNVSSSVVTNIAYVYAQG